MGKDVRAGVREGECRPLPRGGLVTVPCPRPAQHVYELAETRRALQPRGQRPLPGTRRVEKLPFGVSQSSRQLVYCLTSPPPLAGCWSFFWETRLSLFFRPAACSSDPYCHQPFDETKTSRGSWGKARCQQVTPPRSGFKSAFKGPRAKCTVSWPKTMQRSRGESQLAHVFLFPSY